MFYLCNLVQQLGNAIKGKAVWANLTEAGGLLSGRFFAYRKVADLLTELLNLADEAIFLFP